MTTMMEGVAVVTTMMMIKFTNFYREFVHAVWSIAFVLGER